MKPSVPAALISAALLAGCGSSQTSETALLQGQVYGLITIVNDLQGQISRFCVDKTPSGDVVTPCPGASRVTTPRMNTGVYDPVYLHPRYYRRYYSRY